MALIADRFLREGRDLPPDLEVARQEIEALARSYGLDFFDTVFVMCTYEEINMLAAYGGFPTRYPHWRFGMDFLEMQKSYEFGLSKIYEMVINTDPSYAYLMDCNLPVDQKLVMAHVFGHVDFFKNNMYFAPTNRKMLDTMANHAAKVRRIMDRQGVDVVEKFIERCVSVDNLIDPFLPHIRRSRPVTDARVEEAEEGETGRLRSPNRYMDRYINPPEFLAEQQHKRDAELQKMRRVPEEPDRDVLGFLLAHAPLERWQHEILEIVRDEAYYFAPQGQTKIMNEGWATYWHTFLMTKHILSDSEVVDYADHHSGTVATRPGQLNPYALGVALWRHIEQRWNKGQHGKAWLDIEDPDARAAYDDGSMKGREKLFEVRRTHNDVSFIDTFLTEDFVREHGMFTTRFDKASGRWIVDTEEFLAVKQQILNMLATRGAPRVYVIDNNAFNRGELLLNHPYEGLDIQLDHAAEVLGHLERLWGRPVHLQTHLEAKPVTLTHDGAQLKRAPGHPVEAP